MPSSSRASTHASAQTDPRWLPSTVARVFRAVAAGLAAIALLAPSSCTGTDAAPPARPQQLVVFAAASLREAFSALSADFARAHPGVEVIFNFAGTQELRTQLEHGAHADVFASADSRHMDELRRAGRVSQPVVFARNEPVVIVAREVASSLLRLEDLPTAARIVIGAPEVPIGRYTVQVLDRAATAYGADFRARVEAKVASRELNVRQVLHKVSLGEAQAGIVYRTDAMLARDRVSIVSIPRELNVVAEYPIAVVDSASNRELAQAWVSLVLAAQGQHALRNAGFAAPSGAGAAP